MLSSTTTFTALSVVVSLIIVSVTNIRDAHHIKWVSVCRVSANDGSSGYSGTISVAGQSGRRYGKDLEEMCQLVIWDYYACMQPENSIKQRGTF